VAANYDASAAFNDACTYSLFAGTCITTDDAPPGYPCNLIEALLGDDTVNGLLYWLIVSRVTVCGGPVFESLGDGFLTVVSSMDLSCLPSSSQSFSDAETEGIVVGLAGLGCLTPPCVTTYENGKLTASLKKVTVSGDRTLVTPPIFYQTPSPS
ncbi:MAG: hypothetical protein AAFU61_18155, partial [Pseudomonadota bacterium]